MKIRIELELNNNRMLIIKYPIIIFFIISFEFTILYNTFLALFTS